MSTSSVTQLLENGTAAPYTDEAIFSTNLSGTGKTMLTLLIAGYFGLNIYTVTLSIGDASLKPLFQTFLGPALEDIDVVKSEFPEGAASVSALLGAIDGLRDGHIVIITTRHIERLDGALRQPGCVNVETKFPLADKETITRLFRRAFYKHQSLDLLADQFAA